MTKIVNQDAVLVEGFYTYQSESGKDPVARITVLVDKNASSLPLHSPHAHRFHEALKAARRSHLLIKDWLDEHEVTDFSLISNNLWLYESKDLTDFLCTFKYSDPPNVCNVRTFTSNITDIDMPDVKY